MIEARPNDAARHRYDSGIKDLVKSAAQLFPSDNRDPYCCHNSDKHKNGIEPYSQGA